MSQIIIPYIILISFNLILLYFNSQIAFKLNLLDKPDSFRKLHTSHVPLTGGLFFLLNLFLIFFLNIKFQIISSDFINPDILIFYLLLFIYGFYDDKKNINPNIKLLLSILFFFIFLNLNKSYIINELSFSFGLKINLGMFSIPFTIFCLIIFQNAFNMFDGINLQNISYFLILTLIISFNIFYVDVLIFLIPVMVIMIYLNYNTKLFLGDSGSYLLSFFISILLIHLFNNQEIIFSDNIFLFLCIPGYDLLRLAIYRLSKKKHPFEGDREHLHHLLIARLGYLKTLLYLNIISFIPIVSSIYFKKTFYSIILSIILYLFTFGYLFYYRKNFKND